MTEVSVETCFVNLRVLSFSLKFRQKDTLTCVTWRDRKPVSVLGTVPTSEDDSGVVERSTKVSGLLVKQNLIVIILYLTTCHLGAESSFKREHETNYK